MKVFKMKKSKTKMLILSALFAALTAVGAFIKIPIPFVPVTMQVMFVSFAAILLGPYYGALSQLVYIFTGLSGIPVFAKGGGFTYVFQPSFGFLIGFVFAAYAIGRIFEILKEASFKNIFIAVVSGQVVIYATGLPYLYMMNNYYLSQPLPLDKIFYLGFSLFAVSGMLTALVVSYISAAIYRRTKLFV